MGKRHKCGMDFLKAKQATDIIGKNPTLTVEQHAELDALFNEVVLKEPWHGTMLQQNVAKWIKYGQSNWIELYHKSKKVAPNSKAWFDVMYGVYADELYETRCNNLAEKLPSSLIYWTNLGYNDEEAIVKRSEHQKFALKDVVTTRENSVRCIEYWLKTGLSPEEAQLKVKKMQGRDADYFIELYGVVPGMIRYDEMCQKRKTTWESKDKKAHGKKTAPKGNWNPTGQEMTFITKFLLKNNISMTLCKFGKPSDQFHQYIEGVGQRRYDLAVFEDESHTKLKLVLEYHGPIHVNFSDYDPALKDEIITINNKKVPRFGTYGKVVTNDMAKKEHIKCQFPNAHYIVVWHKDLINERFDLDELLQRCNK